MLTFRLTAKDLASFDSTQNAWVAEAGDYFFQVGASSLDIRLEGKFSSESMVVEKVSRALVPKKVF